MFIASSIFIPSNNSVAYEDEAGADPPPPPVPPGTSVWVKLLHLTHSWASRSRIPDHSGPRMKYAIRDRGALATRMCRRVAEVISDFVKKININLVLFELDFENY